MKQIKIVVCDKQQNNIDIFRSIVQDCPEINVVGVAKNCEEAIEVIEKELPDIVFIDTQLEADGGGIKAVELISKDFPHIKSIVTGISENDELIIDAYIAGAVDYVAKTDSNEAIFEKINKAYNNKLYLGAEIAKKARAELKKMREEQRRFLFVLNEMSLLTPREHEILYELYSGNTQTKVADMKHLELSTVKFHVNNILKKLRFKTIKDLNETLKTLRIFENNEVSFLKNR